MGAAEAISKIAGYVIFTLSIILAITLFMLRMDNSAEAYVENTASSFVDKCRTTGEINPINYENFAKEVYSMGYYEIKVEVEKYVSYPDGAGGYRKEYFTVNQEKILSEIYGDDGTAPVPYQLNPGDEISVKIIRTRNGMGTSMLNLFTDINEKNTIVVNYGGIVGSYGH